MQRSGGRHGEIDFIFQHGPHIIPIEVKAVRLDSNSPTTQNLDVRTTTGNHARYRLISLPLYMAETIPLAIRESRELDSPRILGIQTSRFGDSLVMFPEGIPS